MNKARICVSSALRDSPTEVQVIPFGRHETDKGSFVLDETAVGSVISDFRSRKNQMVIDYEHQTLRGGVAPAAGWIKGLMDRGADGLWAEVEWTARARQYLGGCEYRYLSPVFLKSEVDDRVVRLINAALTNQPAIDGMVPVPGNDQGISGLVKSTGHGSGTNRQQKEESMQKVLESLGLEKDRGEEKVVEAIGAMRRELDGLGNTLGKVRVALGLGAEVAVAELEGAAIAMKQEAGEALSLRQRLVSQEAEALVELAMKDGKVTPAQKEWAIDYAIRDVEAFSAFVAKAPVVMHMGEAPLAMEVKSQTGICPVQAMVNSALGLSQERFMKFSNREVE